MLLWPGTALAAGSGHSPPDLQIGLAAGIAVACAAACAVAWIYSRAAIFGAGLAFALVEGILRAQPALFPAGALQAGSYAALLALSIPLISGRPVALRLAAACHWTCIALTGVAALALIFVYDGDGGKAPALIAGAGAAAQRGTGPVVPGRGGAIRPAKGRDGGAGPGLSAVDRDPGARRRTRARRRLPGVAAGAAAAGAGRPAPGRVGPARHRLGRPPHARADADQLVQGELRLVEMASALDTQRQMNALISHELRAPLATISAAAQSLDMILSGSGETVDSRLARIHRSVSRMTELMEQLLNQDRLGEQAWTPRGELTDMSELASDVVMAMQPDTAHALRLQTSGDALPVYCDRPLTSVVVRNLIHNAVKYSPASEPIRIETGQVEVNGAPMAWVAVTDRGPGIGPDEQARIFEPRFRRAAHRETQGMGIGLYLARRICQSQGGSLTMQSEVGVGTRFVITLPARAPAPGERDQAANT
ncbi:sensor histidine kinase [Achromobacter xylosoxidans]